MDMRVKSGPACGTIAMTASTLARLIPLFVLGALSVPAVHAQETVVSVATSKSQAITQEIRATGSVTSPRAAMLSTAVGGLIDKYAVDIGDVVAAGDKLVELDADLARFELEGARAGELEIEHALQDAQRRYAEAAQLGGEQGVVAATEIESRRAEVAMLEASLAAARAAVRQRQEVLARHTIRAPFSGVVSERPAEIGEWVNPGDALLRLVATADLQFDFRLPQDAFGGLAVAMPVTLSVESMPGQDFAGRIVAIVPVSDPGDRTFLLRAAMDDGAAKGSIVPGMSARLRVVVDTGREGVVVPRDAILRYPDGRTVVWVLQPQGEKTVARERLVTLGQEFDGGIEIRTGLKNNERVVVRGNEGLRDGQLVAIRSLAQ